MRIKVKCNKADHERAAPEAARRGAKLSLHYFSLFSARNRCQAPQSRNRWSISDINWDYSLLAECGLGKLSHHCEQQTPIALRQMGRIPLHLGKESDLFLVQVQAGHLLADGLFGEELRELQVERTR